MSAFDRVAALCILFYWVISLHIRSMWETICDAWACWSGWNFGPNSTEYPYSEIQFQNTPPPKNWNLGRSWHFDFSVSEYPPPKNWNLGRSWHFDFSVSEYPPENENCQRSWHFDFSVSEYPPQKNLNLVRSWHFDFSVSEYPPSPRKLKFRQILALWLFSFRIPPPPKI